MNNLTVKEMWDSYVKNVLATANVKEGSVQYQETRRSFYAGVQSMMGVMGTISNMTSEEQGIAVLNDITEELQGFVKDMLEGRA
jgi:hypothetical protein